MGRSLSQHRHNPSIALHSTLHTTIQNREPRHVPRYHTTATHPNLPSYGRFLPINMYLTLHTTQYIHATQGYITNTLIHLVWYLLQPSPVSPPDLSVRSTLLIPTSSSCKLRWVKFAKIFVFHSSQQQQQAAGHTEYYRWAFTVVLWVRPAWPGLAEYYLSSAPVCDKKSDQVNRQHHAVCWYFL